MTLAARLIANKNRVRGNASRVPTLHGCHLSVHHYNREGRKTQNNRHSDKRILFPSFMH
jgi:hypothetical protein